MAKLFPEELKTAKQRFPKALADKKNVGPAQAFCSRLLGGNKKVSDLLFKPNIPIRPIYSCCTWFLTDTSETLRNIMLVCGRVAVLWQQHQSQSVSTMKISEFLTWTHPAIDDKLTDDSLKWECVLARRSLFRIILMFSAGTFKTWRLPTSSKCIFISTLVSFPSWMAKNLLKLKQSRLTVVSLVWTICKELRVHKNGHHYLK